MGGALARITRTYFNQRYKGELSRRAGITPGKAAIVYPILTPEDSPIGGSDAAEVALNGRVRSTGWWTERGRNSSRRGTGVFCRRARR